MERVPGQLPFPSRRQGRAPCRGRCVVPKEGRGGTCSGLPFTCKTLVLMSHHQWQSHCLWGGRASESPAEACRARRAAHTRMHARTHAYTHAHTSQTNTGSRQSRTAFYMDGHEVTPVPVLGISCLLSEVWMGISGSGHSSSCQPSAFRT